MFNLIEAKLIPRLGLATGTFLLWAAVFLTFAESHTSPAENLVMLPVILSSILFGIRGGVVGTLMAIFWISSLHVVAGVGPFTRLLYGSAPFDVLMMLSVSLIVGYGRQLQETKDIATQRADSTERKLDRLDAQAQIIATLGSDVGKLLTSESILSAMGEAISKIARFDRLAIYQIELTRVSAKLVYVSGEQSLRAAVGSKHNTSEILGSDPFDFPLAAETRDAASDHPDQILHKSIRQISEPIAFIRIWSRTRDGVSDTEARLLESITSSIVPVLKRAGLQAKFEHVARINSAVEEFASAVHKNLDRSQVVQAATTQIARGLRYDFFAFFVVDTDGRRLELLELAGQRYSRLNVDDVRLLSEVELDPIADDHTKIWTIEECQIMKDHSQIAQDLTDSELESVIVQNLRMSGEIIAQILIGFRDAEAVTAEDVEFVGRIGHHLIPALENARQTASLRQLQQQLLGHNEQLAQMQDVTEYAEGDLRLSNKRLGEANESKSQFLAEVAHEFKTPLTVIIGYANLLSESTAELGEEQQSFARSIEKSAQQLTSLISDLGDISKIESGQFTSSKSLNDISDGVKQIVDGMRISNPAFRDRLECTGFHIKNNIVGDPSRLGQVFTNLITNALKYSPTDQPVSISIESNNDKVVITVTDKGIGISEDDLSKLFTPYFRSSNPDALKRDGTGLGLFLSKSIVEEHQGEISVSSTPGSGSAFSVELPLARGMRDTEAA